MSEAQKELQRAMLEDQAIKALRRLPDVSSVLRVTDHALTKKADLSSSMVIFYLGMCQHGNYELPHWSEISCVGDLLDTLTGRLELDRYVCSVERLFDRALGFIRSGKVTKPTIEPMLKYAVMICSAGCYPDNVPVPYDSIQDAYDECMDIYDSSIDWDDDSTVWNVEFASFEELQTELAEFPLTEGYSITVLTDSREYGLYSVSIVGVLENELDSDL